MIIIIVFILHWYLSLFCQTIFHHRYAAHQMFTMTKFWEKTFFIFSYLFQGVSYLSPYAYGIIHRMHHAYADTKKDPHSPKYSSSIFDMMWKTKNIYTGIFRGKIKVEKRFTKNLPQWTSFDWFADSWYGRTPWLIIYIAFYYYFAATNWWLWLLLPIQLVMGPFHGAIINWFAHKIGYISFKLSNTSTNLMPLDIFMLGEGYHNNHHKTPDRPNFGNKWYELDPTYPILKILNLLSIIKFKPAS